MVYAFTWLSARSNLNGDWALRRLARRGKIVTYVLEEASSYPVTEESNEKWDDEVASGDDQIWAADRF